MHSDRLTAPKGWEVVRITPDPDALKPSTDDLEALANAVREAAKPRYEAETSHEPAVAIEEGTRRGHLRVVPDVSQASISRKDLTPELPVDDRTVPAREELSPSGPPEQRPSMDELFDHERLW